MPVSSSDPIWDVVNLVTYWKAKSVLDIGCGFGKYGVLLREYLDISRGRLSKKSWKTKIDAVEIFPDYLTPVHSYVYDNVFVEDIRKFRFKKKYDLILFCDVIEHMSKKEGFDLLRKLVRNSKHVLLTTPISKMEQGALFGNKHEVHISGWKPEEFKKFKPMAKMFSTVMLVRIDADRQ